MGKTLVLFIPHAKAYSGYAEFYYAVTKSYLFALSTITPSLKDLLNLYFFKPETVNFCSHSSVCFTAQLIIVCQSGPAQVSSPLLL